MDVLQEDPSSLLACLFEFLDSFIFLSLTHRDVKEFAVSSCNVKGLSDSLDVWGRIDSREEDEEDWDKVRSLLEGLKDVERRLVDVLSSHVFDYKQFECVRNSVWSKNFDEHKLME